jgi:PncC family amidohydrolase
MSRPPAPSADATGTTAQPVAEVAEPEHVPLTDLAVRVGELCRSSARSIALGESCTGGLVGHVLTEVAGASEYLRGGVVAYADAVKVALLDVPSTTLADHGAVSAQTAIAMASGARSRFGADVGVAVTGIAGPTGGSAEKPVGLTYVAVADAAGSAVRRHLWHGDRSANKEASARATLELLLERLAGPA